MDNTAQNNFEKESNRDIVKHLSPAQQINNIHLGLKNTKEDTNKVNLLNSLSEKYQSIKPDSSIYFANQAILLSQKIHWDKGIANGYLNIGNALILKYKFNESINNFTLSNQISLKINYIEGIGNSLIGIGRSFSGKKNFNEAKKYYLEAIRIFMEGKNQSGAAKGNLSLGTMFQYSGENDSALVYYQKSTKIAEGSHDLINMSRAFVRIGQIYQNSLKYEKALEYFRKSVKINEELGEKEELSFALVNIGFLNIDSSNYPKAKEYFEKSLELYEELGNKREISYSLINIGLIFLSSSNYPKAMEYYEKSLKIAEESEDKRCISFALVNIGLCYTDLTKYQKALEFFERSLKIEQELDDKSGISRILFKIASVYEKLVDNPKALAYYEKALKAKEEFGNESGIVDNPYDNGPIYINFMSDNSYALEYFEKALKLNEELRINWGDTFENANIGTINLGIAKDKTRKDTSGRVQYLSKAKECFERAINQFKKLGRQNDQSYFLFQLSETYEALGDYKSALQTYKDAKTIKDSIFSSEIYNKIFEIESQKDKEIKQKETEVLKNEAKLKESELSLRNEELANLKNKQKIQELEFIKINYDILIKNKRLSDLENEKKLKESELKQKDIEAQKKANEIVLLNKEKENQKIRIENQNKDIINQSLVRKSLIGGLIFVGIILALLFMFLRRKSKDNKLTKEKNLIIEKANIELTSLNNELAERNIEITYEREKSDNLLLNILPPSIATRLKKGETTIADYFEEASVIFIDQVNFTQKSSSSAPERVVEVLNEIYSEFDNIAEKYGLEKIKTVGDCYMAASGIPVPRKDHAIAAASFVIEAMQKMSGYKTPDGTEITFRCGMDCGPIVAGVIGKKKFIYDLWGDTVNTASRMESNGINNKIQVTERFKLKIDESNLLIPSLDMKEDNLPILEDFGEVLFNFKFEERGEIEIKGKGKMKTYILMN